MTKKETKESSKIKVVSVVPFLKTPWIESLNYFSKQEIKPGDIVSIPFKSKIIDGIVIKTKEPEKNKIEYKKTDFVLKKIIKIKDEHFLKREFLESVLITSEFFVQNPSIVLDYLTLKYLKDKNSILRKIINTDNHNLNKNNLQVEKLIIQENKENRISFYKTYIRESFAQNKSVCIVFPTHKDISSFQEVLEKGIEEFVFILHNEKKQKEILKEIENYYKLNHPSLILITPQYLSILKKDLGTIVLEKENENTYKVFHGANFDLRFFIEVFCEKTKIKLILSDQLLRLETIHRKYLKELQPISNLSFRIETNNLLKIEKKVKNSETINKKYNIINEENIKKIKENIDKNKNVFIFALKKGLASFTLCKDCKEEIKCKNCQTPLTLYFSKNKEKKIFICNKCKEQKNTNILCSNCGGWNLISYGIGTDSVVEEIKNNFPWIKIFQLDKENIKTKKQAQNLIREFENAQGCILVGTEMAFFYLNKKVDLSIIASFDSLWSIPNYQIREKIIKIILNTINNTLDQVIIETNNTNDVIFDSFKKENLLPIIKEELEDREKLLFPPYVRIIKISIISNHEKIKEIKDFLEEYFKDYNIEIYSNFILNKEQKYTTNVLIQIPRNKWTPKEIEPNSEVETKLLALLNSLPKEFKIQIDPEELF